MQATGSLIKHSLNRFCSRADFAACWALLGEQVLTKALLPLPDKWHGLTDVEKRYRQRYLDMIASDDVRATFRARSAVVSVVRRHLEDKGFLEVGDETGHKTLGLQCPIHQLHTWDSLHSTLKGLLVLSLGVLPAFPSLTLLMCCLQCSNGAHLMRAHTCLDAA